MNIGMLPSCSVSYIRQLAEPWPRGVSVKLDRSMMWNVSSCFA
jgi:hypothetical protein